MDMKEPRKFENEVRPLRLSEAIRRGAEMFPIQVYGHWYDSENGGACAMTAAAWATGLTNRRPLSNDIRAHFGIAFDNSPLSRAYERILYMNCKGVPHEEIASWLEAQGL